MQNEDGSFILLNNQEVAAPYVNKPGEIIYFNKQDRHIITNKKSIQLKVANNFKENKNKNFFE
jgi:hypothetical protein